jgi:hypothetical protein
MVKSCRKEGILVLQDFSFKVAAGRAEPIWLSLHPHPCGRVRKTQPD